MGPEIDERVDVLIDGIGGDVQKVVEEDVRLHGAHEEPRGGARIVDADHARLFGAAEVVLDDLDAAARRAVLVPGLLAHVHEDGDVLGEDALGEGDELLGDAAEDDARIGGCVDGLERDDERRRLGRQMHRLGEERVLGANVAQHRGRGHLQLAGDVGERGRFEPLGGENVPGHAEELLAIDGRRASHL